MSKVELYNQVKALAEVRGFPKPNYKTVKIHQLETLLKRYETIPAAPKAPAVKKRLDTFIALSKQILKARRSAILNRIPAPPKAPAVKKSIYNSNYALRPQLKLRIADIFKSSTMKVTEKNTAFRGFAKTYDIPLAKSKVPIEALVNAEGSIINTLKRELTIHRGIKTSLAIRGQYHKANNLVVKMDDHWISYHLPPILNDDSIAQIARRAIMEILKRQDEFSLRGSGWILDKILECTLNTVAYKPLKGRSYIELPAVIKKKQAVINVKNDDDMCFKWAVLSALHPQEKDAQRVTKYKAFADSLHFGNIKFPVRVTDIGKFEDLNQYNINVFGLDSDNDLFPIVVSEHKYPEGNNIDLLLITQNEDEKVLTHYCWIKDINRLIYDINNNNNSKHLCRRCLKYFSSAELLVKHGTDCSLFGIQRVTLPKHGEVVEFKNYQKQLKAPFVIYADFESLLEQTAEAVGPYDTRNAYTKKYQKHTPNSFCLYTACINPELNYGPIAYRGVDCMERFVIELRNEMARIKNFVKNPAPMIITAEQEQEFRNATNCHICEKPLPERCPEKTSNYRVRDHCHVTGNYRGAAHNDCNINFKYKSKIPIMIHNLRGYDSHLILKHYGDQSSKITCIPNNTEKYMAFSIDDLQFLDSFQFMNSSLDALVTNLAKGGDDCFKITKTQHEGEKLAAMLQKGVYPYSYADSWDKFDATELPPIEAFYNDLDESPCDTEDYEQAQKVWNLFECKTFGEYHDLYLKSDVLLLADVFENFREMSLSYYGIDPCHYYTTPGMGWDAMLKMTKIKLELLTDIDMHLFMEKGTRGGICMISNRYAKANNKYLPDYDESAPSSHIMYYDANNLYGWAMCQSLPTGGFRWLPENEINTLNVLNISDDSAKGYMLEVDLKYPEHLHDAHSDYPLAPERKLVKSEMLSEFQKALKTKLDISDDTTEKLVPNLGDKTKYICHYRYLKMCIEKGLQVTKIHRVIEFDQSQWLKQYVDFNTAKRAVAKSDFEKDFFKLMNNAVFGKTMENIRKRVSIEIVANNERRIRKVTAKPNFDSLKIFSDNFVAASVKNTNLLLNKPVYIGPCVLDLSKYLMSNYHYDMKETYGDRLKLLFTDTDSLCYQIQTEDIYKDMGAAAHLYDTSDYPRNHPLYSVDNKKVIGKFKDELNGKPISEFVGLRPKMYSVKVGEHEKKVAKGVKKSVIRRQLKHSDYRRILFEGGKDMSVMRGIRSYNHQLYSVEINKVGLCAYDTKRYILPNGIDTLAHGHYKIQGNTQIIN
jgi:hypothetical protein